MDQHTYDLAFVGPKRRPRTAPEIVFIISERHLPEVVTRLHLALRSYHQYIRAYLKDDPSTFTLPIPDLFGNKEFGMARCGYWTVQEEHVYLRLPIKPHPAPTYTALTIFLLTKALNWPFESEPRSNQHQMVDLMTLTEYRSGGHGHSVGGWLSEDVIRWLKNYAQNHVQPLGMIENAAPMHPEVIRAQQAAAHAMLTDQKNGYVASKRSIYGWVRDSGAFSMNCAGDACDLSVYPDRWLGEGCEMVELGCHNLDSAEQQLTLLAGLAKMLELARNDDKTLP